MKKQLLFVALSALVGGGNLALAGTSVLSTDDGWTKITSINQTDIADNYYVIVDNASDLMLGLAVSSTQGNKNAMFYQTSTSDLTKDLAKVWILEANGNNYALRNLSYAQYQLQTEYSETSNSLNWRTNDQGSSISWTELGLSYSDDAWTLKSMQYQNGRPLGIYNNGTGSPANGTEIGANDSDKGQKFQIYSTPRTAFNAKLMSGASATSPADATFLIYNPTFDNTYAENRIGCWSGIATYQNKGNSGGNLLYGNGAIEMWCVANFNLYQKLTNLPDGKYKVSVQLLQSGTNYTAELYATSGGKTTTALASTSTSGDFATNAKALSANRETGKISVEAIVSDGTMTIGLTDPSSSSSWIVFDNFTMQYLGAVDLSEYVTNYNTALTAAKAISQNSPMNTSVKTALSTAISNYSNVSTTDKAALIAATSALNTAATNATASIEAYAKAKTILESMKKFTESTNFYTADALNTYYTTPKNKYDAGTLTNDEIAKLQDPYVKGGWKSERNVWGVLRSTWADETLNINTWSTEGDTDGSGFVRPFVEWWVDAKGTLPAGTKTGTLELGEDNIGKVYEVTANVRVQQANNKTEAKGITMDVNGGASVNVCDGSKLNNTLVLYLKTGAKAYGLVGSDKKLNINFTASDDNTINWVAFKDVKYTETNIAVLNEDNASNTIAAAENTNIAVKRSFTANTWNSVVLPFSMTKDQVKAFFGEGTKTATFTGATAGENNTITLNFTTNTEGGATITANTPCLVYPAKNLTFAVAEGVSVVAPASEASLVTTGTDNTGTNNLVDFVGTYKKGGLSITSKDYFLSTDNKLYQAKGGESIKAFRAIFRLKDNKSDGAKVVMSLDGYDETTSIQNLGKTEAVKYNVYNLAGQLVKRNATSLNGLQKGLYIVNGKKVVVD